MATVLSPSNDDLVTSTYITLITDCLSVCHSTHSSLSLSLSLRSYYTLLQNDSEVVETLMAFLTPIRVVRNSPNRIHEIE